MPVNRTSEIARLERELENLRASYAAMQRGAIYAKNFMIVTLIAALVSAVYSLVIMNVTGIGVSMLVAGVAAAIIIGNQGNWIYVNDWGWWNLAPSVETIETMIRDRERTLAELTNFQG